MKSLDLIKALDRGLDDDEDQWGDENLHVSDLRHTLPDGGCLRQLQLRLRGAEKRPATLGQRLRWDRGHYFHSWVVDVLRKGLNGTGWGIRLVEERIGIYGLVGRLDLMMEHTTGSRLITDVKTVRGKAFRWLDSPKDTNVIQVEGYAAAKETDGGLLLYLDREGENAAVQFPVARNDKRVSEGAAILRGARDAADLLPILSPKVTLKENKASSHGVYLKAPWQCDYCEFRDASCAGALPASKQDRGIVARLAHDGSMSMTEGNEDLGELVFPLLGAEKRERGRRRLEERRKAREQVG